MENIEHRTTKVRSQSTNGFVGRMNRTLLDKCFRVKRRETFYLSIAEIQRDLDDLMTYYNSERSHQGDRLNGHTPAAAALRAALGLDQLPSLDFATSENEPTPPEETMVEATT